MSVNYASDMEDLATPTANDNVASPANGMNTNGKKLKDYTEVAYLTGRARVVNQHFPSAMGIDDFLHRLEIALYAYGFNGDNAIGKKLSNNIVCSSPLFCD